MHSVLVSLLVLGSLFAASPALALDASPPVPAAQDTAISPPDTVPAAAEPSEARHGAEPAGAAAQGIVGDPASGRAIAADDGDVHHADHIDPVGLLPLWTVIPFVGILLSIALFPLIAPHFWHRHFPRVSAFWALAFAIPFLVGMKSDAVQSILHIYLIDYIPFILLLWALFTIAGGIYVGGAVRGSPRVNVLLLLIGTFLASWIGTTGAAMVMIRPVLRANAWRKHRVHVVVFFIFLVANVGGSLTPLGDPPLFLGFLHGVPFFWVTRGLLPHMLLVVTLVLAVFFVLDTLLFRREREAGPESVAEKRGVHVEGLHNLLFLAGVMAGVIFSGAVKLQNVPIYGHVEVALQNIIREGWLILMGLLSLVTTSKAARQRNEFNWFPIKEVAYLFAGIFMTIIPALAILKAGEQGALAGLMRAVQEPLHYFWATGVLSSFLDNAPTYLTFFNAALGHLGLPESQVPALLGYAGEAAKNPAFARDLTAISAGAVFMGANTYIGNAPNFMVKSIAEEAGVPMPTFFGYMVKYSLPILVPIFVVVTLIFFL
ncbi:MAG: sodium:proton antiporter [Candidatus Krumholzibacteriia bacterium]